MTTPRSPRVVPLPLPLFLLFRSSGTQGRGALLALAGLLTVACAGKAPAPAAGAPAAAPAAPAVPVASSVRVGLCGGIKDLEKAKAVGFDYVELSVRDIAKLDEAEFAEAVATHARVGLPTPVANNFVPGEIKLVGPAADPAAQDAYVARALPRMARLGVRTVVFGSGAARRIPDGVSREQGFAQLVDVAKRFAVIAERSGIVLAVEPLRREESNVINTAAEGLAWVQAVAHPHFQLMVDLFHLASEKEDAEILSRARAHIRHFHVANPNGRVYPMDAAEYDYGPFFAQVRALGFDGGMSVEAKTQSFEADAPRSIAFLRAQLASR
jgi:sugar phosphate isomerase/epimerase